MSDITVKYINARLTDETQYRIPYWEARATEKGPCLLITSALHGNEIQGAEVLRRVLPAVRAGLQRGACLFVPMANIMAVRRRQPHIDFELGHYYGSDNINNVNCAWPGKADGSNGQRLAHAFYQDLLPQATHLFDLHCYSRCWAAIVYARTGNETSLAMARACALRFAKHGFWKPEIAKRPIFPCTQSDLFYDTGRTGVTIELSGQYGFCEREVRRGVRAVLNCLRLLRMLPGEVERDDPLIWLNDAQEVQVAAPHSGLFMPVELNTSDPVEKGMLLGHILDDRDLRETPIHAPVKGYLHQYGVIRGVGRNIVFDPMTIMHPFVTEGETIAVITFGAFSSALT
ncbi:MAG: succinylglutamate desuccinylase/aspartoacylase family protein [Kiritimatiellae bacterium]|nr:succinylglutamate desuccinylase/aspartoacylase family protein [Kiritimatiellia bacterium]